MGAIRQSIELHPQTFLPVAVSEVEEVEGSFRYTPEDWRWLEVLPVFQAVVHEVRGRSAESQFRWRDDFEPNDLALTEGEALLIAPRPPEVLRGVSGERMVVLLSRLVGRPDEEEGRMAPTYTAVAAIPLEADGSSYGPISPCPTQFGDEISAMAASMGIEPDALLDDLLSGGTLAEEHRQQLRDEPPEQWEGTDPQRRILDPGFTPTEGAQSP